MTRRLTLLFAVVVALAAAASATAHPLGNFTVNRFSLIQPSGDRVYVLYVLDMAEIPTFQAQSAVADEGEGRYATRTASAIARDLRLRIDGAAVPLTPVRQILAFPPGQAGLRTTRLEVLLTSPPLGSRRQARLEFADTNYANRIGWKEVVVRPGDGARVGSSSAPATSISDELLAYPKSLLQSPLDTTSARATMTTGTGAGSPPALLSRQSLERRVAVRAVADNGFASLIAKDHLSIGFVLLSLVLAAFWGAAHALTPGHGKSVITAYLVGSRGTARHAVLLGLTTTVTHTIGVFTLGLVTLALSEFIVPEQLYPWLNLVSALLVLGVGFSVLRWRVRDWRHTRAHHHHHHAHAHEHRSLLGVAISGGLLPCPTALVVLLAAISLHRVGYGLALILAFSVGLAGAITGVGMLAVTAKRLFDRVEFDGAALRLLPAVSAFVILGLGLVMTLRALPHIHA